MNGTTDRNLGRIVDLVENDERFSADAAAFDFVQETVAGLKRMRKHAGLTQAQMAKRLGISQGRVSQIESGLMDHAPNLDTIAKYTQICGVTSGVELHRRPESASRPQSRKTGAVEWAEIVSGPLFEAVGVSAVASAVQAVAAPKAEVMSTKQLGAALAAKHAMSNKAANAFLEDMVGVITKQLKKGVRIRLNGLGILQILKRATRMGRNPVTGEQIKIKAGKKVAIHTEGAVKSRAS